MKTCDIRIRDPYVLTDTDAGRYYLYGTTDENPWSGPGQGFSAYVGTNLADWQGPFTVFAPPVDFWADCQFWAPEVHRYAGCYYMLASFKAENRRRGVQILRAKSPLGPFVPISDGPITRPSGSLWMERCIWTARAGRGSYSAMNGRSLGMGQFAACGWKRTSAPQQKRQLRCFTRPKADGALRIRGRLSERQGKIM